MTEISCNVYNPTNVCGALCFPIKKIKKILVQE